MDGHTGTWRRRRITSGAAHLINFIFTFRAFSLPNLDREHIDHNNGSHQKQRDQGLREHYMKPKITAPQNKNARPATTSASLLKEM
jgi:hypothetical protein